MSGTARSCLYRNQDTHTTTSLPRLGNRCSVFIATRFTLETFHRSTLDAPRSACVSVSCPYSLKKTGLYRGSHLGSSRQQTPCCFRSGNPRRGIRTTPRGFPQTRPVRMKEIVSLCGFLKIRNGVKSECA